MKVIFKDTGEVKEVAFGYAVNYLIPQGLAVVATPQAIEKLKKQQVASSKQQEEKRKGQEKLVEELRGRVFTIEAKVGEGKKLFGSITKNDILKVLGATKDQVEIILDNPIKTLGKRQVALKIGERRVKVRVNVKKLKNKN